MFVDREHRITRVVGKSDMDIDNIITLYHECLCVLMLVLVLVLRPATVSTWTRLDLAKQPKACVYFIPPPIFRPTASETAIEFLSLSLC